VRSIRISLVEQINPLCVPRVQSTIMTALSFMPRASTRGLVFNFCLISSRGATIPEAMSLALIVLVATVSLSACARINSPEPPEFTGAAREAPNWVEGTVVAQNAKSIVMRANEDGRLYRIDVATVDFADCRIDCLRVVHKLDSIGPADKLCIGFVRIESGVQVGKVWVNRYACPGPVIPP
jgi:hypothetical protein